MADDRPDDPLAPFGWHPEPELIGVRDAGASREALERAGEATWRASLDWLYDHAMVRAMGRPTGYAELRRDYFGERAEPGPAPADPAPLQAVLDEFATRIAPHTLNSYHPRALSYFTPPPLVASIAGEVLAQWTNQGVDVWHAGPVAAFVEEEVVRWLCDLVGYGRGQLRAAGVGRRDGQLHRAGARPRRPSAGATGASRPPRGAALEGVRVYASDQAHFSIARALDELGFPPETLALVPADDRFRLHAAPVAEAIARDRARRPATGRDRRGRGIDQHGLGRPRPGARRRWRGREGLWLHVDAAYGGAARLSARDAGRVPGLELADSVTIDPHKWFFQAYDVGALLVRDGDHLREAFDRSPEYYRGGEASPSAPRTCRGCRRPREPAELLQARLRGHAPLPRAQAVGVLEAPRHERLRPPGGAERRRRGIPGAMLPGGGRPRGAPRRPRARASSASAISPAARWPPPAMRPADLDAHQDRLAAALEQSGDGWLSTTSLRGSTWLRAGIVNYLTTEADIDRLLATLRRLA